MKPDHTTGPLAALHRACAKGEPIIEQPARVPYRATLSARRQGAIGAWQRIDIEFSVQGAPRDLTRNEASEAAIIAAHGFGWEVNHVQTVSPAMTKKDGDRWGYIILILWVAVALLSGGCQPIAPRAHCNKLGCIHVQN